MLCVHASWMPALPMGQRGSVCISHIGKLPPLILLVAEVTRHVTCYAASSQTHLQTRSWLRFQHTLWGRTASGWDFASRFAHGCCTTTCCELHGVISNTSAERSGEMRAGISILRIVRKYLMLKSSSARWLRRLWHLSCANWFSTKNSIKNIARKINNKCSCQLDTWQGWDVVTSVARSGQQHMHGKSLESGSGH